MSSGSGYAYLFTHLNDCYDPFVTGSGTPAPFLTPLRDTYNIETVIGAQTRKEYINKESFPVTIGERATNTTLGSSGSQSEQFYNAPQGSTFMLPGTGSQNRHVTIRKHKFQDILGHKKYLIQSEYAGSPSASPTDLVWDNAYAYSNGSGNLTNGVIVQETLQLVVRFSQLTSDISTYFRPVEVEVEQPSGHIEDLVQALQKTVQTFQSAQ